MTTTPEYIDLDMPRGQLTPEQIRRLLKPIDPNHVESKRGLSYIAQFQARAELTRIFGFGNWDTQVIAEQLLYETRISQGEEQYPKNGKGNPYYVACYKVGVKLNIRDYWGRPVATFVEYHAEENAPLPNRGEAHAMALTSAQSYAFRRAAIDLGDRLGLGLYDKGSMDPLVIGTLQLSDADSPHHEPHKKFVAEARARVEASRQAAAQAQSQAQAQGNPEASQGNAEAPQGNPLQGVLNQ